MTVSPLIAPESSIEALIARCYPEEFSGEDTLRARQKQLRNVAADPIFWDLVSELESGDLDQRLGRIEERLDRMWVLLEKLLRTMEAREGAHRER